MELTIKVLWNTDETSEANRLNLKVPVSSLITREVTLYTVDNIIPEDYEDKGTYAYTRIHSGGQVFIVPYSMSDVRHLIRVARLQDFVGLS